MCPNWFYLRYYNMFVITGLLHVSGGSTLHVSKICPCIILIWNNFPYCLQVFYPMWYPYIFWITCCIALCFLKEVSLNVKGTGNFLLGHYSFFYKKNAHSALHSVLQFVGNRKHKPTTAIYVYSQLLQHHCFKLIFTGKWQHFLNS